MVEDKSYLSEIGVNYSMSERFNVIIEEGEDAFEKEKKAKER